MKRKLTFLSVLLVAALLLGMMPVGMFRTNAYAATTTTADPTVQGSKTADKTALNSENRDVEITLSLPSAEYENKVDIVFVMDSSTSTKNANLDFEGITEELFSTIDNTGIDLKVGVIRFTGYASDAISIVSKGKYSELVEYEESVLETIQKAITTPTTKDFIEDGASTYPGITEDITIPGRGTNAHGALILANEWLSSDTDVPNNNKYVIFFTDGKDYIWNNEDNEPVTYYSQYASWTKGIDWHYNSSGKPVVNQSAPNYCKEYTGYAKAPYTSAAGIQFKSFSFGYTTNDQKKKDYYERLYNCSETSFVSELNATNTKFDEKAYWSGYYKDYVGTPDVGDGTVVLVQPNNLIDAFEDSADRSRFYYKNVYLFEPDESTFWKDIDYLQYNPYEIVKNEEDGSYSYDITRPNDNFFLWHADSLEKGTYLTGHYWKEVICENYHTGAIARNNVSGSGTNIAGSFNYWIVDNCEYGAFIQNATAVNSLFEDINRNIQYMVNSGTVTDPIPAEFDLKLPESGCPFTIETEKDGVLEPSGISDNKWGFGLLNESADGTTASTYKYEVEYKDNVITWTINVPVENANKVQLTYTLTIKEESAVNIDPGYDTNGTTTLTYKSTDDGPNDPPHTYNFEIPKVTYTKNVPVIVEHYLEGYVPEDDQNPEGNAASGSSISGLSLVGVAIASTSSNESDYGLKETVETNGMAGDEFTADQLARIPEGYFFDEATTTEFGYARTATIGEDGLTIKLYYSKNVHKVTYVYEGDVPENAPDVPAEQEYKFGADVPKAEVPTLAGWTFNGWNGEVETMPDEDVIVKGSWEQSTPGGGGNPTTYKVTYQYTGTVPAGAPSTPATKSYTAGAAVPSAATPSMEGYTFSGWSGEVSTMPNHDVTVTGSWSAAEPIDDPDTPLAPPTGDDTEIDDPDTPLAPSETEDTEIDEEATPLSPFTGDSRHTAVWAGISVAALLGIIFLGKKRKING